MGGAAKRSAAGRGSGRQAERPTPRRHLLTYSRIVDKVIPTIHFVGHYSEPSGTLLPQGFQALFLPFLLFPLVRPILAWSFRSYWYYQMKKISVSLPDNLVTNLDYLAARTGTSRSAIISEFLSDAVDQTRKLFELVPPNPTPAEIVRMRGQSEEVVRQRLSSLQGLADDLFAR